ncbi:hypothetical protein THOG05_10144 [Vibrio rotiferianus]|nr:hypothetical protein THOG05_10144 [Vibrio rotiferianus]
MLLGIFYDRFSHFFPLNKEKKTRYTAILSEIIHFIFGLFVLLVLIWPFLVASNPVFVLICSILFKI